ncbi:IS110 family transposase [Bacteroides uniformis]|nr:IS110 family transposase [Bacteroides uniformis]
MSVDGVGRVVATNMIITTEVFTRFDDSRNRHKRLERTL